MCLRLICLSEFLFIYPYFTLSIRISLCLSEFIFVYPNFSQSMLICFCYGVTTSFVSTHFSYSVFFIGLRTITLLYYYYEGYSKINICLTRKHKLVVIRTRHTYKADQYTCTSVHTKPRSILFISSSNN